MSNQEQDFLRQARMAALMAGDDDEAKDESPPTDSDALVSEKTKENLKKAGALAAGAGRWSFGKAKAATVAAAKKATAAKADFEEKRDASVKRKAVEAQAVEAKACAEREAAGRLAEVPTHAVSPDRKNLVDSSANKPLRDAAEAPKDVAHDVVKRGVPRTTRTERRWLLIAGGLIASAGLASLAFYLANTEKSAPAATSKPVGVRAPPVTTAPSTVPLEPLIAKPLAPAPEVPEVLETRAVVAPPMPQAVPASTTATVAMPTTATAASGSPVMKAPPSPVAKKPRPAPVKPAPTATKSISKGAAETSTVDMDEQMEKMEDWFEKRNQP